MSTGKLIAIMIGVIVAAYLFHPTVGMIAAAGCTALLVRKYWGTI